MSYLIIASVVFLAIIAAISILLMVYPNFMWLQDLERILGGDK